MTPLDYALAYAALGWRVVPIPPGCKYPKGVDDWPTRATTDVKRITAWWTKNPTHGIGLATGPGSGVFAIDIDPRHGGDDSWADLEREYGAAPETVEAITGGDGRHLVFAHPDGITITNCADHLPVGIDVRGDGGQIVVAPTIHPLTSKPYAWEVEHDPLEGFQAVAPPPWLLEILTRPPIEQEPRRERVKYHGDSIVERFNAAHTWPDLLGGDGWSFHSRRCVHTTGEIYELWTRPGKQPREGASASLYYKGSDVLKVFTSEAQPLEGEKTYSKYGYEAQMRHGNDMNKMGVAARAELGPSNNGSGETPADVRSDATSPTKPSIVHNGRQLDDLASDGVRALAVNNDPPTTFVRSGLLVRLREDESQRPLIETLRAEHIRTSLADAANWYRVNKDGERTSTSPPMELATTILVSHGWPFPALAGVVELPVLRPDGSFHVGHGYDPATRLYHWHRGDPYAPIAEQPTSGQVAGAVALIDEMLHDFPWDTAADRANAWALLLTPLVRAIVGQVPMALIDAPEPGTGKGLLVKACSIVTTGHAAAMMAWPTSDEELEKKVSAALMAGSTVVVFDNVDGTIKSPTLAAVLTADTWQGRILGRSEMTTVPNRATWAATGNNIDVGGDLARRCYRIRLDARQAQPWLRTGFRHDDLEGWTVANRSWLLHALCTIVRSWWVSGQPKADALPAMGGYSSWVRTVGGILDHAGITHFLANLAEFHASADREAGEWEAFLSTWFERYGEQPMTVSELITAMADQFSGHVLREVLPGDIAGLLERPSFAKVLGLALRKRSGRHHGSEGLHLTEMPRDRRRVAIYSVTNRSMELDLAGVRETNATTGGNDRGSVDSTPAVGDRPRPGQMQSTAGVEGSFPLPHDENSYPQGNGSAGKSQGSATPPTPATPAVNQIPPAHGQEVDRGSANQLPRPDPDLNDVF